MTMLDNILAVANKERQIRDEINVSIMEKYGKPVNSLDDVATAIKNLEVAPANSIIFQTTRGSRKIYFDAYEAEGNRYDFIEIKEDAVKEVNYGDITHVYTVYGTSAHALKSLYLPCFVEMGSSAEIYFRTSDALENCEVGSVNYPQTYNRFQPIFGILYNNMELKTLIVYIDANDPNYETFVSELTEFAETIPSCTLTIYDVTNGIAEPHIREN